MNKAQSILSLCEQNYNVCPVCGSSDIEDTEEGTVYPNTITQEYKCNKDTCGARWDVEYHPVRMYGITKGEDIE